MEIHNVLISLSWKKQGNGLRYRESRIMEYNQKSLNVSFFANYYFQSSSVIDMICAVSDVLILNYGVHINTPQEMREMFEGDNGGLIPAIKR